MPAHTVYPGYTYDKKSRRYRDPGGSIRTKAEIRAALDSGDPEDKGRFGGVVNFNRAPDSEVWASIERIVGLGERGGIDISADPVLRKASQNLNTLLAFLDQDDVTSSKPYKHQIRNSAGKWELTSAERDQMQPPQPIPTGTRSAMALSEYYTNTQGDVFQHIEAPIDLSITELEISVPKDKGIERNLRDLYGPEQLHLRYVLEQNMLISSVFGSAYPMEVPDDRDKPSIIRQIIQLPPKFMWVGYHMVSGMLADSNMPSPYAMRPWDNSPNWTVELAQKMFMPMTYNAFGSGFNEQIVQGWGLPVNPYYLHPVRAKAWQWTRYPQPPISRAFRSISTRSVYQEMRRAILEGYKNQLWLFLLGSDKLPPSPGEMSALKAAVEGMSGARTGNLVWRNGLTVEVKAPMALNDSLGSEAAQVLSLEIFRDLGSNARLVSGNKISMPGSGAGDSGVDIDMSVWLRRLEHIRARNMEWEYLFRMRQADRWDEGTGKHKAREALKTAKVRFSKSLLEVAEAIKQEVIPLYSVGLYSPQTALQRSGGDYETELKNQEEFEPDRDKFMPMPTYNQTATSADGKTTQSATAPKGRTPDVLNPNKLKADWDENKDRKKYIAAILALLAEFLETKDVAAFVEAMKDTNVHWLNQIGVQAYRDAGGAGSPDLDSLRIASTFVNSFADNFGSDLQAKLDAEEPVDTDPIKRRTMLYPQEGFKMSVMNMTNQALAERGASHWRRVLHPELSETGSCEECVADSQIIHGMAEPFVVMHPNDRCGTQDIFLQYFTGNLPSIEIPVPGSGNDMAQEIFGNKKLGKTRRKRL